MWMSVLQFAGGLVLLLVGGRLLVTGAVDAARRLGVSPLVVGLTLVAWGTSAPELALNLISAFKGRGDLALGNVVGANICNMALVLGTAALIRPLVVDERLLRVEIWFNAAGLGLMAVVGIAVGLPAWFAGLMLLAFVAYSFWTVGSALRAGRCGEGPAQMADAARESGPEPMSWLKITVFFATGLILLSVGGGLASDGASGVAVSLGVPAAVVGVTIVSIGTTLPELITSIIAVRKGQTDLAMGNAIGSCLFNAGAIFGLTGLLSPAGTAGLMVPLLFMGVLAVALVPISRTGGKTVSALEGLFLLGMYVAFLVLSGFIAAA